MQPVDRCFSSDSFTSGIYYYIWEERVCNTWVYFLESPTFCFASQIDTHGDWDRVEVCLTSTGVNVTDVRPIHVTPNGGRRSSLEHSGTLQDELLLQTNGPPDPGSVYQIRSLHCHRTRDLPVLWWIPVGVSRQSVYADSGLSVSCGSEPTRRHQPLGDRRTEVTLSYRPSNLVREGLWTGYVKKGTDKTRHRKVPLCDVYTLITERTQETQEV